MTNTPEIKTSVSKRGKTTDMVMFKLLEQTSLRWHKLAGAITMVLAGAILEDGKNRRLDKYLGCTIQ